MRKTVLRSIETGNPPLRRSQEFAAAFMTKVESLPDRIKARIPAIYGRSAIEYRYSALEDYGKPASDFEFYPPNWRLEPAPSTGARNALYREASLPLATDVAQRALDSAGVTPNEVTHVIAVSCTGMFAPGLDIELVRALNLRRDTRRAVIGFMGCYAALNGLRVADGFCKSHPDAVVLLVCVELCTLHFQIGDTMESAVVNSLFSDGAAAAVLASSDKKQASEKLCYTDNHCVLDEESADYMTWDVGNTGFDMGLSARVPDVLARHLPDYVDELLGRNGLTRTDVGFWAIHPGGRAIVDKAQSVLGLGDDDVSSSLDVLRMYGNMSSPTILFVLKKYFDRHKHAPDDPANRVGIAFSFGPGLTLEGCLWISG